MNNLEIESKLIAFQPENLAEVLEFVGECNRLTNFANFHPGDIAHAMSNTYQGHNLDQHFWLYRDENNKIIALGEISRPEYPVFELTIYPQYRGSQLDLALLKALEKKLLDRLEANNIKDKMIITTVLSDDDGRRRLVEEMGYQKKADYLDFFNARSLQEPIPQPDLPEGYTIRSVAGEHEVGALVEVHSSAFNSNWTESKYLAVMRTPGYVIERELVVVAPDNSFAAFTIYWLDPVSSSGLFEPVGCHKDFQRKGLTKALMYEGMRRMKAAGMQTALVLYRANNASGKALYTSAGFRPIYEAYHYYSKV